MSTATQIRLDTALATMAGLGAPVAPAMAGAAFTKGFNGDAIASALAASRVPSGKGTSPGKNNPSLFDVVDFFSDVYEIVQGLLETFGGIAEGNPCRATEQACQEQQQHEQCVEESESAADRVLGILELAHEKCASVVEAVAANLRRVALAGAGLPPLVAAPIVASLGAVGAEVVTGVIIARNRTMETLFDVLLTQMARAARPGSSGDPLCEDPDPEEGAPPGQVEQLEKECPKQQEHVDPCPTPSPAAPAPIPDEQHECEQRGGVAPPQVAPPGVQPAPPEQPAPPAGKTPIVQPAACPPAFGPVLPQTPVAPAMAQPPAIPAMTNVAGAVSSTIAAGVETAAGAWQGFVAQAGQAMGEAVQCPPPATAETACEVASELAPTVSAECAPAADPCAEPELDPQSDPQPDRECDTPESPELSSRLEAHSETQTESAEEPCPERQAETETEPTPPADPQPEPENEPAPAPKEEYRGFDKTTHPSHPGAAGSSAPPAPAPAPEPTPPPETHNSSSGPSWTPDVWVGASATAEIQWENATAPLQEAGIGTRGGVEVERSPEW